MSNKGLVVSSILSGALVVMAAFSGPAIGDHGQGASQQNSLKQHAGELVQAVRDATRRFRDVNQAEAEGYHLLFGCVSGPDDGAMGLHWIKMVSGHRPRIGSAPS